MASQVKQRNNKETKKVITNEPALNETKGSPSKKKPAINDDDTSKGYKFGTLGLPKKKDQVWSRFVLMTSVLIIVIVMKWRKTDMVTWVPQKELAQGKVKSQPLICSQPYFDEISKFKGCAIKQCGRFVVDGLFSDQEIESLLGIFQKGLQYGHSSGGASILDLHSGALSKGENFINIFSATADKPLWSELELSTYKEAKDKVKQAIIKHFNLQPEAIYLTSPTFFSQMTTRPAKTIHDEYWHPHVDKETYETFHFTSLLYLSDYGNDFQGGRFVFMDGDRLNRTVEPRKGRVSMFTSGGENLHYVEKVTDGIRYALTIAFTCDVEKAIPDPQFRH